MIFVVFVVVSLFLIVYFVLHYFRRFALLSPFFIVFLVFLVSRSCERVYVRTYIRTYVHTDADKRHAVKGFAVRTYVHTDGAGQRGIGRGNPG